MQKTEFYKNPKFYTLSLFAIIIVRLLLNALIPLMDQTEARYAEIARIMAETGNWVTPQIDYNTPFWAKPPLSTWLSAISIKIFGANEFAARFPSFVISLLLIYLMRPFARRFNLPLAVPAFVLFTIPEFLLHVGVVSTDMTLLLAITMMMVSFWETVNGGEKQWRYLFFVAVGIGFLAKGPIIILLTMPPIVAWTVWFKSYRKVLFSFPWILGIFIVAAVAMPWYYLAEIRTPGFWEYFFVGEHYKRFFDASWKGDKYGFPKLQPFGIIWVFLYSLALPWIIFFTVKVFKVRIILKDRWLLFLVLWLLWTPVFFTSSKSLIHTYILPCCFPLALFVATYWQSIKNKKAYVYSAMVLPALSVIIVFLALVPDLFKSNTNTDKYLLQKYRGEKLYYLTEKTYSSQFYSRGKVKTVTQKQLDSISIHNYNALLLVRKRDSNAINQNKTLIKADEGKKSILFRFR